MEQRTESGLQQALVVKTGGELAVSAAAARAKAEVEAAFLVALHNPRNIDNARDEILRECKRARFADSAVYAKPVAGRTIEGPSIRFVETALQSLRNVRITSPVVYEDDQCRVIAVTVTDLERNASYTEEVTVQKTVERKQVKAGTEVVGERLNSYGDKVYIVKATDDELTNKAAAMKSKAIRNCGLRILPQWLVDEAIEQCRATQHSGGEDPDAAKKKVLDAFSKLGVRPSDISSYLCKPTEQINPKDLELLRGIYAAIRDGVASWSDYTTVKPAPEKAEINMSNLFPAEDQSPVHKDPHPKDEIPSVAERNVSALEAWSKFVKAIESSECQPDCIDYAMAQIVKKFDVPDAAFIPQDKTQEFRSWLSGNLTRELKKKKFIS